MSIIGANLYQRLRALTSPVVAVTTSAGGRRNGMIANSAQRASLVPSVPRVSVYVSKINFSHDLMYASGVFGMHLLSAEQWQIVRVLGLRSGRDAEKLRIADEEPAAAQDERIAARLGASGCPLLLDVPLALECRVVNAMDAGAATFFLGDIIGAEAGPGAGIMTSEHFRSNAPEALLRDYELRLRDAQDALETRAREVSAIRWPGPTVAP